VQNTLNCREMRLGQNSADGAADFDLGLELDLDLGLTLVIVSDRGINS
jgi:hypothetical protein